MLSQLISKSLANFANQTKVKSVRQRIKMYSRQPDKYRLKTLIRPPDLTQKDIVFPIRIPIRYRHIYRFKKQPFLQDTSKIHWSRLQPNQVLLGFENTQYLTLKEVIEGLRCLSEIKGQQQHDWNKHQWVSVALNRVNEKFDKIKDSDIMKFYFLMKKLRNTNEDFWKKMYAKIQENFYDLYPGQLQYIFLTYYDVAEKYFSPEAKGKLLKLMQGRLREFSTNGIIQIFEKFIRDKKIDTYWLENVFVSLFKHHQYRFNAREIARIFRSMMILGHENNDRLYQNLYSRIQDLQIKNIEDIQLLEEVFLQVKQIFASHRVDSTLQILADKKQELIELKKQESKKTIEQMVRNDLVYFLEKRKLKQQEKGAQAV